MSLAMTKRQLLLFVLIIVSLLVMSLVVIHSATPSLWHLVTDSPDVPIWWH